MKSAQHRRRSSAFATEPKARSWSVWPSWNVVSLADLYVVSLAEPATVSLADLAVVSLAELVAVSFGELTAVR